MEHFGTLFCFNFLCIHFFPTRVVKNLDKTYAGRNELTDNGHLIIQGDSSPQVINF